MSLSSLSHFLLCRPCPILLIPFAQCLPHYGLCLFPDDMYILTHIKCFIQYIFIKKEKERVPREKNTPHPFCHFVALAFSSHLCIPYLCARWL